MNATATEALTASQTIARTLDPVAELIRFHSQAAVLSTLEPAAHEARVIRGMRRDAQARFDAEGLPRGLRRVEA